MGKALSVPGVSVNNDPIEIVPNSFAFRMGDGDINVRAASTGGGGGTTVHTEDAESKKGMMKFKMYVTDTNIGLFKQWKPNIGTNFLSAQQPASKPLSGQNMSLINDPDWEASADGIVELEFEGDPLSNNT